MGFVILRSVFEKALLLRSFDVRASFATSLVAMQDKTVSMEHLTYEETLRDTTAAFLAGVAAVRPSKLVKEAVHLRRNVLSVKGKEFPVKRPAYVVGFGKAVLEMALAMEDILGESMKSGIISVPVGSTQSHQIPSSSRIQVLEGAFNNLPDKAAEKNAKIILNSVKSLDQEDILLVLISGGGSALLTLPQPPIILEEKLQLIKELANAGANISQLNSVRKCLSCVKGGRLASAAQPATVIALILSDVIGDPVDVIASGPTSPSTDLSTTAWEVIRHFKLENCIPSSVRVCLTSERDKSVAFRENTVHNFVIGNNSVAISTVLQTMVSLGYSSCALSGSIQGDVAQVAKFYSVVAFQICQYVTTSYGSLLDELDQILFSDARDNITRVVKEWDSQKGVCVVAGGEITVNVTGSGIGGRNQELALRFADESKKKAKEYSFMSQFNISLLSAGTDGIDGPTVAAGAFGYAEQLREEQEYKKYLLENDSNSFYSKLDHGKNLIQTGHTGTNVMDIHILTIQRK